MVTPGRSISLLLALTSAAAAMTGWRLFTDEVFIVDAVLIIVLGHGMSGALSWTRGPRWLRPLAAAVAVMVLLGERFAPGTSWWGVPTGDSVRFWRQVWQFAIEYMPASRAPVDYDDEWAALFSVAIAVTVVMAEIIARVLRLARWAVLPSGIMFGALLVLGRGQGGTALASMYLVAALIVLATRTRLDAIANRVRPNAPRRLGPMVGAIVGIGAATATGVVIGPVLPSTSSDAWINVRARSGSVVSFSHPIVDIRGRLVDQSDVELFTVETNRASYWRLASLADFDGVTFSVIRQRTAPTDTVPAAQGDLVHEVVVKAMAGRLIPAAPDPVAVEPDEVQWFDDSASLVSARPLAEGDRITITSRVPNLTPSQLRGAATSSASTAPTAIYTALPSDLPDAVAETARRVVSDRGIAPRSAVLRPYRAALALQNWFRDEFDYDLDVTYDRGSQAVADFLTERRGYCEQFSVAFAAMARTLGIPSRVAVGFTPGIRLDATTWSVQGRHAHAWPEIWIADVGWVGFEPTPGRGAPGAEQYTGVSEAQVDDDDVFEAGTEVDQDSPELAPEAEGSSEFDELLADLELLAGTAPEADAGEGGQSSGIRLLGRGVIAGTTLMAGGPLIVRWIRRSWRRRRTPAHMSTVLWPRLCGSLQAMRLPVTDAMTPREVMALTTRRHRDLDTVLEPLVAHLERVVYGPADPSAAVTTTLREFARVRRALRRRRPWAARVADYLRPWRD